MDDPSQSIERIWTRLAVGNLFIDATIYVAGVLSSINISLKLTLDKASPPPMANLDAESKLCYRGKVTARTSRKGPRREPN
jgi:hypothetical protein